LVPPFLATSRAVMRVAYHVSVGLPLHWIPPLLFPLSCPSNVKAFSLHCSFRCLKEFFLCFHLHSRRNHPNHHPFKVFLRGFSPEFCEMLWRSNPSPDFQLRIPAPGPANASDTPPFPEGPSSKRFSPPPNPASVSTAASVTVFFFLFKRPFTRFSVAPCSFPLERGLEDPLPFSPSILLVLSEAFSLMRLSKRLNVVVLQLRTCFCRYPLVSLDVPQNS